MVDASSHRGCGSWRFSVGAGAGQCATRNRRRAALALYGHHVCGAPRYFAVFRLWAGIAAGGLKSKKHLSTRQGAGPRAIVSAPPSIFKYKAKLMRGFLIGLVAVLLLIAGAAYWAFSSLDSLVEAGIEKIGSELTGTDVEVGAAAISLAESTALITGFTIANPAGFSNQSAFALDNISVTLDTARSNRGVIAIKELRIENPVVNYEISGKTNNIDALRKTVERNTSGDDIDEGDEEVRFVIDRFIITKGEIKLATGGDKIASSDLPAISMNNIGANKGGVTGTELGQIIVGEMSGQVKKAVASGVLDEFLSPAEGAVKSLTDQLFK